MQEALPGVEAASVSRNAPLSGRYARAVIDIEGRADIKKAGVEAFATVCRPIISKRFRHRLLLRGRGFTGQDRAGAPRGGGVNKAAAEGFFPGGGDPIGKRLRPYVTPRCQTTELFIEIVGVVAGVPMHGRLRKTIGPDVYVSAALQPTDQMRMLNVRSRVEAAALTGGSAARGSGAGSQRSAHSHSNDAGTRGE